MKKLILAPLFIFIFVMTAASQTPSPTPPADDDVVKISTTLIQVDVTVTDSKGKIVTGLKPEDFEIYENGEKQKITNLSFVSSVKESTDPVKNPTEKVAVPVPPTELKAEKIRRTFALVIDDLSLSFQSAYYVRRSLKKFVDEQMQDGDLVAIIRTGAGIGALQQFTADKRQLYAAIEKVVWNPTGRGNIGAFAPIRDNEKIENPLETEEDKAARENSEKAFDDFRGSYFATGTLGALRYIVTGMKELPGRKSVILFSDGFKILQRDEQGFSDGGTVLEFLRQLVDTANRASVVFYTIDARGLQTTGITAEDSVNAASPERIQQVLSDRSNELFDTQSGLTYLAQQTGGFAILNNNDLSGGVRKVLDDQSYYLIAYEPDSDTFDAKTRRFNKLVIKVKNKDVNVRYRSGFFNVADRNVAKTTTNQTPLQQIQNALVSPFGVNDISLRLNALFGNDAVQGSFMRPLLHINAQDLKFTDQPDGTKKAVFDVLAVIFGDNGAAIDQISKSYTLTVKDEMYKRIIKNGFVYYFTLPIKKPGAYQFRVAIRDAQAGKVGSASQFIEVPNLKKEVLTISGIVLENMTEAQWKLFAAGAPDINDNQLDAPEKPNPMNDTSLRRFKRGSILRYGFEIYNAKLDAAKKPNLSVQIRIFRDGKLMLDGKQIPIELTGQTDLERVKSTGAINLLSGMQTGDYILQIIITDNLAKEKRRISTQFVQFEIVE
ncbi:MAG TPA: VWA domain-containing protein [Pyrinomonadaceae bacterium]|nr:VWA domain-containing protein [Pyrinomonadaceae bacterium]